MSSTSLYLPGCIVITIQTIHIGRITTLTSNFNTSNKILMLVMFMFCSGNDTYFQFAPVSPASAYKGYPTLPEIYISNYEWSKIIRYLFICWALLAIQQTFKPGKQKFNVTSHWIFASLAVISIWVFLMFVSYVCNKQVKHN